MMDWLYGFVSLLIKAHDICDIPPLSYGKGTWSDGDEHDLSEATLYAFITAKIYALQKHLEKPPILWKRSEMIHLECKMEFSVTLFDNAFPEDYQDVRSIYFSLCKPESKRNEKFPINSWYLYFYFSFVLFYKHMGI